MAAVACIVQHELPVSINDIYLNFLQPLYTTLARTPVIHVYPSPFHALTFLSHLFNNQSCQPRAISFDKKLSGKSKDEQMAEKKQELEKRLQDVSGQLAVKKVPKKEENKSVDMVDRTSRLSASSSSSSDTDSSSSSLSSSSSDSSDSEAVSKFIQVSMYGPNVNLKCITLLQEHNKSVTDNEKVSLGAGPVGTVPFLNITSAGQVNNRKSGAQGVTPVDIVNKPAQVASHTLPPQPARPSATATAAPVKKPVLQPVLPAAPPVLQKSNTNSEPEHNVSTSFLLYDCSKISQEHKGTRLLRTCYSAACHRDEEQGYFGPVPTLHVTERRGARLRQTCYSAACHRDEEQGSSGPVPALPVTERRGAMPSVDKHF
uniref:Uncharacterized protein n=1 Tax=Timema bartmani TaxID=61472 RepID=A0A7R9HWV0_9NEOP|nr:unnamed protein product [Timema bartmani]